MSAFDFRPDVAAMADIVDGQDVEDLIADVAEEIASAARSNAQSSADTGEGADSIHAEVHRGTSSTAFASTHSPEDDHPTGYVSWDQDHFYMGFVEVGTEKQAARPFLRPALDSARI